MDVVIDFLIGIVGDIIDLWLSKIHKRKNRYINLETNPGKGSR